MQEYLQNLIDQFRLSTGCKNIDLNSEQFINEFKSWIRSRQKIGKEYIDFLDYMRLRFADSNCAEIGKGLYDTVVLPFSTKLITPSVQSFTDLKTKDRIINGNMRVFEGLPVLVRNNEGRKQLAEIPNTTILVYMTQNPFSPNSIFKWEDLHNYGNNNIIVGIFGSIYDKDADMKFRLMETLREKLYDDFKEDYSTSDDKYFYAIGSQRKLKRLVKTMIRSK